MSDPSDIAAAATLLTESLAELARASAAIGLAADKTADALTLLEPEPEPIPPEPVPPGKFEPKVPPATEVVLKVPEDYPSVMAAYEVLQPGQTISCADGFQCGDLTLARKLDPNNWAVLRSRNVNKAIMNKPLKLNGSGLWVHGFKSTYKTVASSGSISLGGDHHILTKMEINAAQGIIATGEKRAHIWIGWCWFNGENNSPESVSNIYFKMPDGGGYPNPEDGPNNIFIYRNDFDDDLARPEGSTLEDHAIYFGDSKPRSNDVQCMQNVELYQNLIRSSNKRVRGFYMKRGAWIYQNQFDGCKYNWGFRCPGEGRIESNIATTNAKMVVNGKHLIVNNKWKTECQLYAGTSKGGEGPYYMAADYANLDLNEGPLKIGYINSGHTIDNDWGGKADHVTVWRHTGSISFVNAGYDAATYRNMGEAMENADYLPRMPLTTEDVGIWA